MQAVCDSGRLLLASESPRRRDLMRLLGFPFSVCAASIEETLRPAETPLAAVRRFAREKAGVIASQVDWRSFPIVIGADTIVLSDGDALGKPEDAAEAETTLRRLRGREHEVYTAIALITGPEASPLECLARSVVPMRDYTDEEIAHYVRSGDPFDKAGAYAIQDPAFRPVIGLTDCYANVMGLPLCHLAHQLQLVGREPPLDVPAACQEKLAYTCSVFAGILAGEAA